MYRLIFLLSFCLTLHSEFIAAKPYTIVVIGSSTAAGAGPKSRNNAWVNRFTTYINKLRPGSRVVNLARGGYTTYHLMPSDFVSPDDRPKPDTDRNITKALSYKPDAIIVNLPSNDAALGFSNKEQLLNFDYFRRVASYHNVPIWFCSPQPRNFRKSVLIKAQITLRDIMRKRYGKAYIDFWSGLASRSGSIRSYLNSGDGVHLNDRAHEVLYLRVVRSGILETLANQSYNAAPNRSYEGPLPPRFPRDFPAAAPLWLYALPDPQTLV